MGWPDKNTCNKGSFLKTVKSLTHAKDIIPVSSHTWLLSGFRDGLRAPSRVLSQVYKLQIDCELVPQKEFQSTLKSAQIMCTLKRLSYSPVKL